MNHLVFITASRERETEAFGLGEIRITAHGPSGDDGEPLAVLVERVRQIQRELDPVDAEGLAGSGHDSAAEAIRGSQREAGTEAELEAAGGAEAEDQSLAGDELVLLHAAHQHHVLDQQARTALGSLDLMLEVPAELAAHRAIGSERGSEPRPRQVVLRRNGVPVPTGP